MRAFHFCLLAALAFAELTARSQNLLTNGGFEFPVRPTTGAATFTSGSGWTVTESLYLVRGPLAGSGFLAAEGMQFVTFNQNSARISQMFPTDPGATYEVSFTPGFYQGFTNMSVTAEISVPGGAVIASQTTAVVPVRGWQAPTRFQFTALTNAAVIQMSGSNATPNVDLLLDDVSVQAVVRPLSVSVSQVQLCWQSETNRSYQIQSRTNLNVEDWTDEGSPVAGNGTINCVVQPVSEPGKFFRVILLP